MYVAICKTYQLTIRMLLKVAVHKLFQYHLYCKFWKACAHFILKPTPAQFILFYFIVLSPLLCASLAAVAWDTDGNIPSIPCVSLVV
jgi:hypothetical protein